MRAGEIRAVEVATLVVDLVVGGVEVLRFLLLAQRARAEAQHPPAGVRQRKHDARTEAADIGMIFVRCRGGISHHPDEHVDVADADAGARVLLRLIENFRPQDAAR